MTADLEGLFFPEVSMLAAPGLVIFWNNPEGNILDKICAVDILMDDDTL